MHIHNNANNNSKSDDNFDNGNVQKIENGFSAGSTVGKLTEKFAEKGIKIERRQGIAILFVVLAMAAGIVIVNINAQPHPVAEFSVDEKDANSMADNSDGQPGDSSNAKKEGSRDNKSADGNKSGKSVIQEDVSITVHIAGAVAKPGVYSLKSGSRINDAINAAGGGTPMSDVNMLNLAEKVADGQKIYVPKQGEVPQAGSSAGVSGGLPGNAATNAGVNGSAISAGSIVESGSGGGTSNQLDSSKIDLNSATIEQLDTLPGVGPVTAQRIIDYRTQHGSFKSVDELKKVDGIGPKKFDQLKPHVVVN